MEKDVLGKIRQKKKGVAENGMVREHHQVNDVNLSKPWETVEGRGPGALLTTGSQRVRHNNDWTLPPPYIAPWSKVSTYM